MKKRLISAAVMLIIFIPLIIIGSFPFEIGITVVSLLAFRELISIYEKEIKIPIIVKVLSYLSVGLLVMCAESLLPCLALVLLFNFIPIIFINKNEYNYSNAVGLFGVIILVGLNFYILCSIRMSTLEEFI
jgi:phosphatidate cytidylyltransferase